MGVRLETVCHLLLLVFIPAAIASRLAAQAPVAPPPSTPVVDARTVEARTDAWAKPFVDAGDFSGVILIAQGDRVLVEKSYGKADPQLGTANRTDTRFRIASVSKTFTAAAVELLLAQGKLRLTDTLSRYVAAIPNGDSITIEHLLLHESGVGPIEGGDAARDCLPQDELLARLRSAKRFFCQVKARSTVTKDSSCSRLSWSESPVSTSRNF